MPQCYCGIKNSFKTYTLFGIIISKNQHNKKGNMQKGIQCYSLAMQKQLYNMHMGACLPSVCCIIASIGQMSDIIVYQPNCKFLVIIYIMENYEWHG